ncbi:MAG: NnrS family protein [Pelagimonas sp.]|jgi:uncharacterized protein involved in response to NO|nr:NnrS family protein [Pelagimonas sp.]
MSAFTAFFSAGFRPMFLGAALWAVLSMWLWIAYWTGLSTWEPLWGGLDWHVHELLFGYASAVLCGFLLTAIPNWTGRPAVAGLSLAGVWALWGLGRVAVTVDLGLTPWAVALIDVSFLALVCAIATRELVLGGNTRNFPVAGMVGLVALANLGFHWDVAQDTGAAWGMGTRLGLALLIMLISLIGGRIIPAFTTNWLRQRNDAQLPTPFNRFDKAVLAGSAVTLLLWSLWSEPPSLVGALLIAVGAAHLARLSRWCGHRTLSEPLIIALHLFYAFVPLGFILTGLSAIWPGVSAIAGIHAWSAGAIGGMTLIVMTRASLGHSGLPLKAGMVERLFLMAIALSACMRIASALDIATTPMLHGSATLWMLGFGLFVARFARVMITPRA